MNNCCNHGSCGECLEEYVCHCLKVTEEQIVESAVRFGLQTLDEVRRHTGAGDGCTACHRRIRQYLQELNQPSASSSPIFSAR
jgi:bacterioferritin-associated ferredoxin